MVSRKQQESIGNSWGDVLKRGKKKWFAGEFLHNGAQQRLTLWKTLIVQKQNLLCGCQSISLLHCLPESLLNGIMKKVPVLWTKAKSSCIY